jgi:RHS repeat-associated protein
MLARPHYDAEAAPHHFYIWSDNLGTPRQVTDTTNVSRWEWGNNDPFGNNTPNENPASVGVFTYNLRFPGQYYDVETGKHYNYYRDFDPSIGRYLQSDPIGLRGGRNTYVYVASNPLLQRDPLGLLVGFSGCSSSQRSKIEQAERAVKRFFGGHCSGCNDPGASCVDCSTADKVLRKLETNTVSCSDSDTSTDPNKRWGASAILGGTSITVYPALFDNPASYRCFTSTLFHEGLHSINVDHSMDGVDERDRVYGIEFKCVRAGLCGGGNP